MDALVAAHRKPKQHPLSGPAARTAATLALAGAATATAFDGTGHAEPRLTPAQIKAKVDRLYQEAEAATEKYNGAKEQDRAARASRWTRCATRPPAGPSGSTPRATPSVRSPPPSTAPAASTPACSSRSPPTPTSTWSGPRSPSGSATGRRTAIAGVHQQLVEHRPVAGRGRRAARRAQGPPGASWPGTRPTVQDKLAAAERLLARLTAEQRAAYERADVRHGRTAARADRSAVPRGSLRAPNARAAQAVAFAYGALGKPYVWGATGPASFDCSGLTQAAWRSAGVSLPRTTYTQINAGQRVSRSELAPGDLVFFYSGISHVGLYIGGGQMIHAPRPGAPVRVAPIDEMPFAGATRVA